MFLTICVNYDAKIEAGAGTGPKSRLWLQPITRLGNPAPNSLLNYSMNYYPLLFQSQTNSSWDYRKLYYSVAPWFRSRKELGYYAGAEVICLDRLQRTYCTCTF